MANNQNTIDFTKFHAVKAVLNPVLNYSLSGYKFSILVKTGQMNNTQPKRTTHHVRYRIIYFEACDDAINGIKERFH